MEGPREDRGGGDCEWAPATALPRAPICAMLWREAPVAPTFRRQVCHQRRGFLPTPPQRIKQLRYVPRR